MKVIEQLDKVFQRIFLDPDIHVTDTTTTNDIEGWDSLTHATLVVAIEADFHITFAQREILKFANVGDMCSTIRMKTGRE